MNDLIGLPQAAAVLGVSRQTAYDLYKAGQLLAVSYTGTDKRPRPLFIRGWVETLARSRASRKVTRSNT